MTLTVGHSWLIGVVVFPGFISIKHMKGYPPPSPLLEKDASLSKEHWAPTTPSNIGQCNIRGEGRSVINGDSRTLCRALLLLSPTYVFSLASDDTSGKVRWCSRGLTLRLQFAYCLISGPLVIILGSTEAVIVNIPSQGFYSAWGLNQGYLNPKNGFWWRTLADDGLHRRLNKHNIRFLTSTGYEFTFIWEIFCSTKDYILLITTINLSKVRECLYFAD